MVSSTTACVTTLLRKVSPQLRWNPQPQTNMYPSNITDRKETALSYSADSLISDTVLKTWVWMICISNTLTGELACLTSTESVMFHRQM